MKEGLAGLSRKIASVLGTLRVPGWQLVLQDQRTRDVAWLVSRIPVTAKPLVGASSIG